MDFITRPTGFVKQVDNLKEKDFPEFDPRTGDHFWVHMGMWIAHPERLLRGEQALLDHENLLSVSPPMCFFCQKLHTPLLAKHRCKGE